LLFMRAGGSDQRNPVNNRVRFADRIDGAAMNRKKKQVCFRIDEEIVSEMQEAAEHEGFMEVGPYCRELVKWALGHYRQAQSLFLLKQAKVISPQVGTTKLRNHL
jgi:hypothetical protein